MLVQLIEFTLNFEMFLPISHLLLVIYTSLLYCVRLECFISKITTSIVCDWTNICKDAWTYTNNEIKI